MKATMHRNTQSGLTLLELMIVLLIVSITSAIGGPTLAESMKRTKLRAEADRILATLTLTRSEAVKRNLPVSVCRSSDGATCTGDWVDGWIIFSNADGDNAVDVGTDEVIRVFDGLVEGYSLSGTLNDDTLTYYSDGSYAGASGTIQVCSPDADTAQAYSIIVTTVGRPRTSKGTASCS